ncbi:ATP-binding cassette domain-containing protein [Actinomadura flavalba]|uniref:ATP-binding cassette domain-containing protein n=1 Tax=Actinomadura flavalba TaxID=1120938 RepID=UPI00035F998C|nr:ABC transporter ATP-binding protein [Actinomadura flavalba]
MTAPSGAGAATRVRRVVWEAVVARPSVTARLMAWSVVEAAPAFLIGLAIARAVDDGFAAGRVDVGAAWLGALACVWVVAAIGARQVVLAVAALVEPFRDRLLERVAGTVLRDAAAAGRGPGASAVARATLQVELARDALAAVITVVRSFAFTLVSVLLGLAVLDPRMLMLVVPPFLAGLVLFLLSLPALARRQRAYLLADERTASTTGTIAGGLRDIVACGAEDRVAADARAHIDAQEAAGRGLARVTAVRTLALSLGAWVPVVLILAAAPWLTGHGATAAMIIGALAYLTQSLVPAFNGFVEGLGVSAVRLAVSLTRLLESGPTAHDARPADAPAAPEAAAVTVRGVRFAYGEFAAPVIDGLDLDVPSGDHLAVVGPSGIGKSTLAALIAGVLVPDAGEVLVGGVPAARADAATRVLIPQEAYVFRGTVRENLEYLGGGTDAAILAAADAVGASALVERLGGLDAAVDGSVLSAGERQLVALVRAYLAPADLVVLDEATCHLDPAAEARAEAAFAARGGTLVVIAHRVSSALRARRVLLMDGTDVRLGTHADLVATAPLYADLVGHWNPLARGHERVR